MLVNKRFKKTPHSQGHHCIGQFASLFTQTISRDNRQCSIHCHSNLLWVTVHTF